MLRLLPPVPPSSDTLFSCALLSACFHLLSLVPYLDYKPFWTGVVFLFYVCAAWEGKERDRSWPRFPSTLVLMMIAVTAAISTYLNVARTKDPSDLPWDF